MSNNQEELLKFLISLGQVSATLSGLCLTILIFSIRITHPGTHWDIIQNFLWWAVILFAITSFRCVDKVLDKIIEHEDEGLIDFDGRITKWEDYGGSVVTSCIAWILFSVAILFVGLTLELGWQSYLGFVLMCVFAILFITYKVGVK